MNDELLQAIDRILSLSPENLKREGKDYEFTDVYPYIKELYNYITELKRNPDFFDTLPDSYKNNLSNSINSLAGVVEQISTFLPTNENPQGVRDTLAGQIKSWYETLFSQLIIPIRVFIGERRISKTGASKIAQKIEDELVAASKSRKEIDNLLAHTKKTTAQVGFVEYSKVFADQAKSHNQTSIKWLKASIGVLIGTILVFIYIFASTIWTIKTGSDPLTTFTIFLAKIFPATILYYVLYQTIRNYNANKHLYVLNKHRENVLRTFELYVNSSSDPGVKDSLLKEAAKAIFVAGDSGYLLNKDQERDGLDLVQIVNDLTKKTSP